MLALVNALLLDPEAAAPAAGGLLVERGRIAGRLGAAAAPPPGAERIDLAGRALAPGFLDVHYHGELVLGTPAEAAGALGRESRALLAGGVTGFLPTTVAWPEAELLARVGALAEACAAEAPGAAVLGLHLEGPWIAPAAAGAQPPAGIRDCDPREAERVLERAHGLVRMVTLAPELPGAAACSRSSAGAASWPRSATRRRTSPRWRRRWRPARVT